MNLKIYTVHHFVPQRYVANEVFVPFVVGDAGTNAGWTLSGFVTVGCGWNGLKHPSFAEMRCHYLIWRHRLDGLDYVGFDHYRRQFCFIPALADPSSLIGDAAHSFLFWRRDDSEYLPAAYALIRQADIIVPDHIQALPSIGEDYCRSHVRSDWDMLVSMLDEADAANGRSQLGVAARTLDYLHPCNMFVMRVDLFREYMDWWWQIMSKLSERITPPETGYQHRTFGFMSERLFTIWLHWLRRDRPELRIAEVPLLVGNFTEI